MIGGELTVGHSYLLGTGDVPSEDPVSVGLLGADFAIENGRYRIKRIYTGENWNPDLRAPLSAPGIQVAEGDYLLEVNGRPLAPPANPYSLVRRNSEPADVDPRKQDSDVPKARVWLLSCRLRVRTRCARARGSRTTAGWWTNFRTGDWRTFGCQTPATPGYTYFTRYYYAQQDKEGAVIDERYNHGGMVADYIVNELDRKLMGYFALRDGTPTTSPIAGIYGPKVMIINESAGSGGDALALHVSSSQSWTIGRNANVGRTGRHARRSGDDRWRRHHCADPCFLQS